MPKVTREPWGEIDLQHLVYELENSFIVFIDDDDDVDWKTKDAYVTANQAKFDASLPVINAAANTESLPCSNLGPHNKLKFKRLVGEAIARGLSFDTVRAEQMTAYARDYNQTRNREISRYWQLATCGYFIAAAIILGFAVWFSRPSFDAQYQSRTFIVLLLAGISGMVGAFFSITSRMANLGTENGSSLTLHIAESLTRIFTGGISGVFGVVAVKSGLVLSNLIKGPDDMWNVLLVGLAAGLSERFVPSIIAKVGLPMDAAPATAQAGQTGQKPPNPGQATPPAGQTTII